MTIVHASADASLAWNVLTALPEGIAVLDTQGAVVYRNAAWEHLCGTGDTLFRSVALVDGMCSILAGEQRRVTFEQRQPDAAPVRWLAVTLTGCAVAGTSGVLVHVRDATAAQNAADDRQHIATQLQATQVALEEAHRAQELLQTIINSTPDWIFIKDQEHRYRLVNQSYARALHIAPENFIGKHDLELGFPEEIVKGNPQKGIRGFWSDDRAVMDGGMSIKNPHVPVMIDGKEHIFDDVKLPLRNAAGQVWGVLGIGRDVTERQRAEEAMRQRTMQEEIIRAQEAALAELSTPLIPLSAQVMVMPLIGAVDSRRAHLVIETLLRGVAEQSARAVILDITGVSVVDTQVANALVRAAQAARLLGAQVIITGIRPEIAQTLIGLGADLSTIITRGSLQSGIAYAMGKSI